MSTPHTPASSTPAKKTTSGWNGAASFFGVVLFVLIVLAMLAKSCTKDKKQNTANQNTTNTSGQTTAQKPDSIRYAPPHDPISLTINGTWSDEVPVYEDYYLSFVCSHDYEIENAAGEKFQGSANTDTNIGVIPRSESTKNLTLRFRTRDNSTVTMRIDLLNTMPIKIKQKTN